MFLDAVHITNKFAQHGDTLITNVTNMPEQMDVRVTDFPESINLTKDVSVLRDSIDSISAHVTRIFNEGIGYPDPLETWALPILVAIFAMSMPLLLQAMQALDVKYHATHMITAYKKSPAYKIFLFVLVVSMLMSIFSPLLMKNSGLEWLYYSLATLLLISTFTTIVHLIRYYDSTELDKWERKWLNIAKRLMSLINSIKSKLK